MDAFATKVFEGNPAAVIPLPGPSWPDDTKMQAIARENNLSETAFLIRMTLVCLGQIRALIAYDGLRPMEKLICVAMQLWICLRGV